MNTIFSSVDSPEPGLGGTDLYTIPRFRGMIMIELRQSPLPFELDLRCFRGDSHPKACVAVVLP